MEARTDLFASLAAHRRLASRAVYPSRFLSRLHSRISGFRHGRHVILALHSVARSGSKPLKSLASCSSPSHSVSSGRRFDTLHRHQYFPQLITLLWLLCSSVRGALVSDFPSPIALALLAPYAVKFPIGRAFVGRAFPLGVRHLEK